MTERDARARLRAVEAFAGLDDAGMAQLEEALRPVLLEPGEILVRQGDEADAVYIVAEGRLEAISGVNPDQDPVLAELGPGSVVGEVAALTGGRRSATLRAARHTHVYALAGEAVEQLVAHAPEIGERLADGARRRLRATRLVGHLRALFPDIDHTLLGEVAAGVEWTNLAAGQVLFRQGEPAPAAYLVVTGRVRILLTGPEGVDRPLAEVGAGELIGEAALLEEARRAATVVASRETTLARFPRQRFEELVARQPGALLPVARMLVARSRAAGDHRRRATAGERALALLPIGADVDLAGFAEQLGTRFEAFGRTAHVSATSLDRALGLDDAAQAAPGSAGELRLARWLEETEAASDLLALQADPALTPWTERCVRHADHLVLVGDATADPAVTDLERAVLADRDVPHQRVSLVLLHDADTDHPVNTAAWLEPRRVDHHHHVRHGHAGDLARVSRHLAGRAVGLVLGGGGARGFAHLGVIRALHEAGVPIDMVAGASIGATLGLVVGLETPLDEQVTFTARAFTGVLDYTTPTASLLKGQAVAESIRNAVGQRRLEDLWVPYLCTSTNLTRARLEVHDRGDAVQAVRASLSIPGVFPPVPYGEDLLVDSGVLNNLPIDVLRRRHPTATIIAVDVAPLQGPRAKADYGVALSGTGVLLRRLTPGLRAQPVPGLMATLMRSLITGAAAARDAGIAAGTADLYLPLDLRGVGMLEFDTVPQVTERGYEAAREPIAAWLAEQPQVPRRDD